MSSTDIADLSTEDLADLSYKELEEAFRNSLRRTYWQTVKDKIGKVEALALKRRLRVAVETARNIRISEIVSNMADNEAELRTSTEDIKDAKGDVDRIVQYISAVDKVLGIFEKILGIVG